MGDAQEHQHEKGLDTKGRDLEVPIDIATPPCWVEELNQLVATVVEEVLQCQLHWKPSVYWEEPS